MAFRDYGDHARPEPIVIPIRGREYRFPGSGDIPAPLWLKLQDYGEMAAKAAVARREGREVDLDGELLSDVGQDQLLEELCADQLPLMLADGVTGNELRSVLKTLMAAHMFGCEFAEAVWNAQGEAPAPDQPQKNARVRGDSPATSRGPSPSKASAGPQSASTGS